MVFRFIIANVRVKSNDATNISLSHFTTSEGIVLSDVESYVEQLEKNSLFLGKKNVWFELVSSETNYLANIFIPVKDNALSSVSLSSDFKKSHVIKFDLSEVVTSKEELGYEEDDIISDIMETNVISVNTLDDQEDVALTFLCSGILHEGSSNGYFWSDSEQSTCFKGSDVKEINEAVLEAIGK